MEEAVVEDAYAVILHKAITAAGILPAIRRNYAPEYMAITIITMNLCFRVRQTVQ